MDRTFRQFCLHTVASPSEQLSHTMCVYQRPFKCSRIPLSYTLPYNHAVYHYTPSRPHLERHSTPFKRCRKGALCTHSSDCRNAGTVRQLRYGGSCSLLWTPNGSLFSSSLSAFHRVLQLKFCAFLSLPLFFWKIQLCFLIPLLSHCDFGATKKKKKKTIVYVICPYEEMRSDIALWSMLKCRFSVLNPVLNRTLTDFQPNSNQFFRSNFAAKFQHDLLICRWSAADQSESSSSSLLPFFG